jgi:hypothetical protein
MYNLIPRHESIPKDGNKGKVKLKHASDSSVVCI